jgi:hypothetical protein
MKPDIPHFNYPFMFGTQGGDHHAGVVEQDTLDDVINCIIVSILVETGTRVEIPTFGVPGQVFELQPLNLDLIVRSVELWEMRAEQIMTQNVDNKDPLIAQLFDAVSLRGGRSSDQLPQT